MRHRLVLFTLLIFADAGLLTQSMQAEGEAVNHIDQGADWTAATRSDFYGRDQGSRMIPLDWLRSLKQRNGRPFLSESLGRYGYLSNPESDNELPVGFSVSGPLGAQTVGMTCSACHTRQINVAGKAYRIDGGPALVDFQRLLSELDAAVSDVLATDDRFKAFAASVLNASAPDANDVAGLRRNVEAWHLGFHALMTRALPDTPESSWGIGRLDAVGMIFNRVTGLDIGPPPSFLIADNIKRADAPVRYPFLWNAPLQDQTQWAGFADNGSDLLALSRNLGQVLGVFAVFHPKKEGLLVNFLSSNSVNFEGLGKIEQLVKRIGPPKWPWALDSVLVAQGEAIFKREPEQGGCKRCHGIDSHGIVRFPSRQTWKTPIQNVGTDTRQFSVLQWTANSGVLKGTFIPFATKPLKETDLAFNILATSVIGSIAEHVLDIGEGTVTAMVQQPGLKSATMEIQASRRLPPNLRDLEGAFRFPEAALANRTSAPRVEALAPVFGAYESRVMQGIWATAPYLHNGSVQSLAQLLLPVTDRVKSFKIGPAYDIESVGLAETQPQNSFELKTTDCAELNSGNSCCGHEFGTQLPLAEKKALLEYLKSL